MYWEEYVSEVVVRMMMPRDCYNCDMRYECNSFVANKNAKPMCKGCRIICCLPREHGELVDRSEMIKKIEKYHRYMTIGRESDPRCIIEDATTIVPARSLN